MARIGLGQNHLFKGENNIWKAVLRQFLYALIGATLYFLVTWLNFTYFQVAVRNIAFYPATAIVALFGVLFGPWVGLFAGLLGKASIDYLADWGFYWNGILAYGLIGLIAGFARVAFQDLRLARPIARAVLGSVVGVLVGALALAVPEAFLGDIRLKFALLNTFLPEFVGNLVVIIMLLPLLMLAVAVFNRNK